MPADRAPRRLRVAALQPALKAQAGTANMLLLRRMVEDLVADAPLDLVVLPEAFAPPRPGSDPSTTGSDSSTTASDSSPTASASPPGTDQASGVRQFLGHLARACSVNVIGGSVELPQPQGRPRNACFVIDRQGNEIGRYDKRVLFSHEADRRAPGDGPGIFELDGVAVGVLICGDLWRPELARELLGAVEVLCVPAMTAVPSDRHVAYARTLWLNLALTRATENALAVAISDWAAGRHDETFSADGTSRDDDSGSQRRRKRRRTYYTCGAASICDPGQRPNVEGIQQILPGGRSGVLRADLDLAALAEYRDYRQAVGLLPPERTADTSPR